MGGFCSCWNLWEENEEMSGYGRQCSCLPSLTRCCLRLYTFLFSDPDIRESTHALNSQAMLSSPSLNIQSPSSATQTPEGFRNLPRPLPFETDIPYLRSREGLSRRDKTNPSGLSFSETDPLRSSELVSDQVSTTGKKESAQIIDSQTLESYWKAYSELKQTLIKAGVRKSDSLLSMADEDCCPTCLDGYTDENPRITAKCEHHFHLGCIYEWMERSQFCPVCNQVMVLPEGL